MNWIYCGIREFSSIISSRGSLLSGTREIRGPRPGRPFRRCSPDARAYLHFRVSPRNHGFICKTGLTWELIKIRPCVRKATISPRHSDRSVQRFSRSQCITCASHRIVFSCFNASKCIVQRNLIISFLTSSFHARYEYIHGDIVYENRGVRRHQCRSCFLPFFVFNQ